MFAGTTLLLSKQSKCLLSRLTTASGANEDEDDRPECLEPRCSLSNFLLIALVLAASWPPHTLIRHSMLQQGAAAISEEGTSIVVHITVWTPLESVVGP